MTTMARGKTIPAGAKNWINKIHQGDALELLRQLPDNFVDMAMSSPPYWGLRDYGVAGQFGLEPTFEGYVRKSVVLYRELRRILKKEGSFYLNLGDTYAGSNMGYGQKADSSGFQNVSKQGYYPTSHHPALQAKIKNIPPKCLIGIPWRVALALIDDGWILRNAIIWHKPNAMPSSVKDRLNNTYEFVFHFVKSRKYYYDLDAVREPHKQATKQRAKYGLNPYGGLGKVKMTGSKKGNLPAKKITLNPKGKNPGDFWAISTKGFKGAHFATYPEELCVRPIKASCPPNGIVLDIFMGAGTTGLVALKLGRKFLGCELNPAYIEIAEQRLAPYLGILKEAA